MCKSVKAYLSVYNISLSTEHCETGHSTLRGSKIQRLGFTEKHNTEHESLYEVRSGVFMLFGWRPVAQSSVKAATGRMTYFWMCTVDSSRAGPRRLVSVHVQLHGPTKSQLADIHCMPALQQGNKRENGRHGGNWGILTAGLLCYIATDIQYLP